LPVCFSRHTDTIQRILVNGGFVKLILDKNILKQFIEQFNSSAVLKFVKLGSLEIWVVPDNLEVACVVSENFASLGLFFENGIYDTSCLLMGHTKATLDWGNSLFQHYQNIAEKIDKTAIKQMEPLTKI
jgi:predicted transcriptional regulator